MDFCYGVIPCCYLVIKDALDVILGPTKLHNGIREALIIVLTLLYLTLIFIVIVPFIPIYGLVYICLKLKHGSQFGGILPAMDTIYEKFNPVITMNVVVIVRHDGTQEKLFSDIKEACSRLHNSHYKYSSIVQSFFGYRYYLKNKIHIDEVVVPVKFTDSDYITQDELYIALEEHQYHGKIGDKRLWEAKICLQPILWNAESKVQKHYALIIRQNHTISDAFSMVTYFKQHLCGEQMEMPVMKKDGKTMANAKVDLSATAHRLPFGDLADYYLKPPHEGSDHHYVFFNETQSNYLPTLFKLKKKYNTTITDILAAGATESISRYFQKESIKQDNIFCVETCRSATERTVDVLSGKIFGNENTIIAMTLPVASTFSCVDKLKQIAAASKKVRFTVDRQLMYICMKLGSIFPAFVSEYCIEFARATLAMTNLPLPEFDRIGNCDVVDMFGFINHFNQFKFLLIVVSHKGQLRLSFIAKNGMVKNRDQLQDMLNDILRYIDRLNEECDSNPVTEQLDTRTH